MGAGRRRGSKPGVVAYYRVSTEDQANSGLGLEAQAAAVRAECARRRLPLISEHVDPGLSGKALTSRPGLLAALKDLESGNGNVLMVSKLDRLSRNVHDATGLLERAEKSGWALVALDAPVDTTTPQGRAMANMLAVFAELERGLAGERTKAALAVKRRQGIRLGRPSTLSADLVERIVRERQAGKGWTAIARSLNDDGVPTSQGGQRWYPGTVRYVWLAATRTERELEDAS